MKAALAAATCLLLLPILVIGAAMGGVQVAQPSANALADIPPDYLALYQEAATELGMPWELLAAVGKVESDHGRNPDCWQPNAAGAVGPMQFLPATFAEYDWASGSTDPSIDDPRDAIYAAAAMLVDNNVRDNPRQALYAYNHSNSYVDQVLSWAAIYQGQDGSALAGDAGSVGAPTAAAGGAVAYALAQLGTPYLWGGDGPGGFDCSGLVQAAYAAAGIQLPANRAGTIRRRAARTGRSAARAGRSRLLRNRRERRHPRRDHGQPDRDGRRSAHRRRRPPRALRLERLPRRHPSDRVVAAAAMWFAYVDESFNRSQHWVAALLVQHTRVNETARALRDVVDHASAEFGIDPTAELHGHDLFHGTRRVRTDEDGPARTDRSLRFRASDTRGRRLLDHPARRFQARTSPPLRRSP